MPWHASIERYAPFSVRGIYTLKVGVATALLLWMMIAFHFPPGSGLVCIAPMMMVAADRVMVRDMVLQVPMGFMLGVAAAMLWVKMVFLVGPIAYAVVGLWALLFIYLGETSPLLIISCRIIAILPAIFFNVARVSAGPTLYSMAEVLVLLAFLGIGGFYVLDHLLFPIRHVYPARKSFRDAWLGYWSRLRFNIEYCLTAVQSTCVILIILGIYDLWDWPSRSMITTAWVSCVVVSTGVFDKLKRNIAYRVLGNVMGGLWGWLCVGWINHFTFTWVMGASVVFTLSFFAYLAQSRVTWTSLSVQAVYAFIAVVDPGGAFTGDVSGGLTRLAGVLYGCLLAYGISVLFSRLSLNLSVGREGARFGQ